MVDFKHKIRRFVVKASHKGEHFAHFAYLGLVSVEAHGHYRFAAMFLLAFTVVNLLHGAIED